MRLPGRPALAVLCAALLCACSGQSETDSPASGQLEGTAAAPAGSTRPNVMHLAGTLGGTHMDWMKTVYNNAGQSVLVQVPLTAYDKDGDIHGLAAESWVASEDGLTWRFNLRENLKWTDGEDLTADDFVFALQRAVTQGYDFSWYWTWAAGVKNWTEVEAGQLPLEELGVRALDARTLELTSTEPKAYIPGVCAFWFPVPRHVNDLYGDEWAASDKHYVSSGPFMLAEWRRGDEIVLKRNPSYVGPWSPQVDELRIYPQLGDPAVGFPAYLAGDIDMSSVNVGQLAYASTRLKDELKSGTHFGVYYLAFDYSKPPFDNKHVRRALMFAIDRDEVTRTVLKNVAVPARTLLSPGYPGYTPELGELTRFDPERARQELAEAGYPNGVGFPSESLWWRIEGGVHGPIVGPMAQYLQAQLKEVLNIDIDIEGKELKSWMDGLTNLEHNFFQAPYMRDYFDPSNFFSILVTGGRHNWRNDRYTELVHEANRTLDWDQRVALYEQAERIIIDEGALIYLVHPQNNSLVKPYLVGEGVEANRYGDHFSADGIYHQTHMYIAGTR
jgi:oligopeptide transport system substrate-binding protein